MPDEKIVLSYDPSDAISAAGKANKAIEENEKTAERAGAAIGRTADAQASAIVSITDRSQAAINRIIQAAERKAAVAGGNPTDRIKLEREQLLRQVAGNQEAVNRVAAAYDKVEEAARRADNASKLQSAVNASRQAAKGADDFAAALNRVNAAAVREREAIEQEIRTLERRAAVIGKTPAQQLAVQGNQAIAGLAGRGTPEQVQRLTAAYTELVAKQQEADRASSSMGASLLGLAGQMGLVIGIAEVFRRAISFGADAILYAARTKQLEGALLAVGKANNVAESTTKSLEAQLKTTGITTQDARQSLSRLIAAQVDYTKATQLARLAQDLGRVAGISSSEAFDKLTHAIVTQQPELLRMLGLNVNLQREFQQFARQTGRTAESLSEFEKKQIAVNAVLVAGQGYAGVYKRSLEDAGGQMLSLNRYVLEAKNAFGDQFQPELSKVVSLLMLLAKNGEEAGAILARSFKLSLAPMYALHQEIMAVLEEKKKLFDPKFDENMRREAEAATLLVRNQKLQEGSTKALAAQEEIRQKAVIAQADAEKKQKEELLKLDERALAFLKAAQLQEGEGLDRIAEKRRQAIAEFGKTPQARANIEKGIAAETAKFQAQFEERRLKDFERFQRGAAVVARENTGKEFEEKARAAAELGKINDQTQQVNEQRQLAGLEARKASELRAIQETAGKGISERLAAEDRIATIERDFALKTFEYKVTLLNQEASLRAELASNEEQRDAILREAAARAALLEAQTQAAIDAAQETAAVRKIQIVRTEQQRLFDQVRQQADGVFDALVSRSRGLGETLKNLLLQAVLTPLKQIFSSTIAAMITGVAPAGGGGGALGGIGRLAGLGGLFSGGVARAGAPGGTPGFAGNVGGLSGMLGAAKGITGGGFGGFGGGFAGLSGATGLVGGGAALGLLGAFKAGQSGNSVLRASAPAIGAVSGLAGFGALASMFPALIGAGPVGWIAAAGIGATIGLIGMFKRRGEDKLIEKVKSVYGITIGREFARNPLAGIIKDQFGGDVDLGIRSPVVRELLSVYRMQSNQSSMGAGLGAMNNVARGVSLTGAGGGVFQNGVTVNGNAYGYGGAFPSSGPVQPFQSAPPVALTLQIDGRDVQASVSRTNQASNGRRETSAVLLEPLTIFG